MSRILAGVMGPGEDATPENVRTAYELGMLIAGEGWVLLTGGRAAGVMDAAGRGARSAQGIVVGILPGSGTERMSPFVDIPIVTALHEARNNINVLSSRILFFVGMNAGTASELALALRSQRPLILLGQDEKVVRFFSSLAKGGLHTAPDAAAAVQLAKKLLASSTF